MGLTVSRKTAKNLAVKRKNKRILTVSRYKILTVNRKSHYPIVTLFYRAVNISFPSLTGMCAC